LLHPLAHQAQFELFLQLVYNDIMKKLLILLLISIGLSGCGRDYEDMLDELMVEMCNLASIDFLDAIELGEEGMEAALVRMEELQAEIENELESLPRDEAIDAARVVSGLYHQMQQIQSGDLSSCD